MYGNIVVIKADKLHHIITTYRQSHNLTQADFAKQTGLSISATTFITPRCTYTKLNRICTVLGVSPDTFIDRHATQDYKNQSRQNSTCTGSVFNPKRIITHNCNRCKKSYKTKLHSGKRICVNCMGVMVKAVAFKSVNTP